MATGDEQNILERLLSTLPSGWYGYQEDRLNNAVLSGPAKMFSDIYKLYQYVKLQTRIKTATEDNLDLISKDFLGDSLPRRADETDDSYRNRILAWIFPFPSTRKGISDAIYLLTGRRPIIFEPWNPNDTGCLNNNLYLNDAYLGSLPGTYEATFFITVFRPIATGKDWPALNNDFYLNLNSFLWSPELIGRQVTDDDIYKLINRVRAAGVTALVEILD